MQFLLGSLFDLQNGLKSIPFSFGAEIGVYMFPDGKTGAGLRVDLFSITSFEV